MELNNTSQFQENGPLLPHPCPLFPHGEKERMMGENIVNWDSIRNILMKLILWTIYFPKKKYWKKVVLIYIQFYFFMKMKFYKQK